MIAKARLVLQRRAGALALGLPVVQGAGPWRCSWRRMPSDLPSDRLGGFRRAIGILRAANWSRSQLSALGARRARHLENSKLTARHRRRGALHAKRQNAMQEVAIFDPVVLRRRGKFLAFRDLRIGIGLQEVRRAVGREPKIDAGIAIKFKRPVNSLGEALNARDQFRR